MATEEKSVPGYKIKVTGEYFSKDPNTGMKAIKFYEAEEFTLPEIVTYVEGRKSIEKVINGRGVKSTVPNVKKGNASRVGLHVIRRYFIEDALKAKFPDFTGVRTCSIFNRVKVMMPPQKPLKPTDIQDMSSTELKMFVTLNDINIMLSSYGDLGNQKNAVIKAYQQKKKDDVAAGKTAALTKDEEALTSIDDEGIQTDEVGLGADLLG